MPQAPEVGFQDPHARVGARKDKKGHTGRAFSHVVSLEKIEQVIMQISFLPSGMWNGFLQHMDFLYLRSNYFIHTSKRNSLNDGLETFLHTLACGTKIRCYRNRS